VKFLQSRAPTPWMFDREASAHPNACEKGEATDFLKQ